jgi:L-rhamnose isomerase
MTETPETIITRMYEQARERYGLAGVDTEKALRALSRVPISIQCWQGDDIGGFESKGDAPGGGLAVTGNYPGKARTPGELRDDLELALSLIPGRHRINLHACYAETGGRRVGRDELEPAHFREWIDWAESRVMGLDFNPTFFGHPKAADGFTLTHPDRATRKFWVEHGTRCREIGQAIGKALGTPCVTNFWIPDGYKDTPVDRKAPRARLVESLDAIFSTPSDKRYNRDSIEPKLFGIGSESYVAGSHEFYLGYAVKNGKLLCLDSGHYHPTESIADKISAVLFFLEEVLLHVSRGIRWDSDHVVTWNEDVQSVAQELVRGGYLPRVHIGLDYFDASINRVAAWVIGARSMAKALLYAMLEPLELLRRLERDGDFTARLALLEEMKSLPFGSVWDYYCLSAGAPAGNAWLREIRNYEMTHLSKR